MNKELCIVDSRNLEVGENPIWDIKNQRALFLDIRGKSIYKGIQGQADFIKIPLPQQIGCLALCENGDFLLAMENGVYRMNEQGKINLAHQPIKIKGRRFNDGKVGPDGAFYLGTTDDNGNGAFYKMKNGELKELFGKCSCSNGIEWTSGAELMYYIDSPRQMIEMFDFDAVSGELSNRRKFVDIPKEWGLPDGMTLDENDNLWVALWGGHRVIQIDKNTKKVIDEIIVPCPKASSCAFGGNDLSELYITTAAMTDTNEFSKAGNTFKVKMNIKGKKINYYKW